MNLVDLLYIAYRNVLRNTRRTLLTLSSISLGVVAIVLSGGFIEDTIIETGESMIHSYSGHMQIARAGYWENGTRSPERYLMGDPEQVRSSLKSAPGVQEVLLRIGFSGLLNNGKSDWPIVGEGVEPEGEARLGSYVTMHSGRQLIPQDRHGILVGHGVAKTLKLAIGDQVNLMVSTEGGAANVLEFTVVGIFQTFSKEMDARAIRISLHDARTLLNTEGAHTAVALLTDTSQTDAAMQSVRALFPENQYEARSWVDLNDFYTQTVALYQQQFGFLVLVIVIMLILCVSNSVSMSIFERTSEFGTMMAFGNTPRSIGRLIAMEYALVGVVGSAVGIGIGIVLALLISAVGIEMPPPPNADLGYTSRIQVMPSLLLIAFLVGVGATLCASALPSREVRRLPIHEALRRGI